MFNNVRVIGESSSNVDEGLRQYMVKVFNYMFIGLCITALASYVTINTDLLKMMFSFNAANNTVSLSAFGWIIEFAPLIMIFAFTPVIRNGTPATAQLMFWAFSALMGMSVSLALISYTQSSIARVFLITGATFGGMSLLGYTTKKDLTALGSFLYMLVWGLIIASIVNIFVQSSGLYYALSYISVFVFTGLTAYDVQNIKNLYYYQSQNDEFAAKTAVMGALSLYIDFINLFLALLRIMGDRR